MRLVKLLVILSCSIFLFHCSGDDKPTPISPDGSSLEDTGFVDAIDEDVVSDISIEAGLFAIDKIETDDVCKRFAPQPDSLFQVSKRFLSYQDRAFSKVSGDYFGCLVGEEIDAFGIPNMHEQTRIEFSEETEGLVTFTFFVDSFFRREKHPCSSFAVKARRLNECAMEGFFKTTSIQKTGTCDLSWDNEKVEFENTGGVVSIDWNGLSGEVEPSDACSFELKKGFGNDIWGFNGATRMATLNWEMNGNDATVAITDKIEGSTVDDKTCEGATFDISLERVTGLNSPVTLPATCASPAPPICGDGVCIEEENCGVCPEDCGCPDGESCEQTLVNEDIVFGCFGACDDVRVAGQCGEGERCGAPSRKYIINSNDTTYCIPTAGKTVGELCSSHQECGDGLSCHLSPDNIGSGTCQRFCDECAADETCQPPGSANSSGGGWGACVRRCGLFEAGQCSRDDQICSGLGPGGRGTCVARETNLENVGDSCAENDCAPGLLCITTGAEKVCRLTCDVDADCSPNTTCRQVSGQVGICR